MVEAMIVQLVAVGQIYPLVNLLLVIALGVIKGADRVVVRLHKDYKP